MRLEPLHFAFRLFSLLHGFLTCGTLLGDDFLEVEIHRHFLARGNPDDALVGFVGSRQLDENGISAGLQMGNNVVSVLVCFCIRLNTLVANSLDT